MKCLLVGKQIIMENKILFRMEFRRLLLRRHLQRRPNAANRSRKLSSMMSTNTEKQIRRRNSFWRSEKITNFKIRSVSTKWLKRVLGYVIPKIIVDAVDEYRETDSKTEQLLKVRNHSKQTLKLRSEIQIITKNDIICSLIYIWRLKRVLRYNVIKIQKNCCWLFWQIQRNRFKDLLRIRNHIK